MTECAKMVQKCYFLLFLFEILLALKSQERKLATLISKLQLLFLVQSQEETKNTQIRILKKHTFITKQLNLNNLLFEKKKINLILNVTRHFQIFTIFFHIQGITFINKCINILTIYHYINLY